jgi:CDP-diacylglycerol--serine O-phosphatidyltransferase
VLSLSNLACGVFSLGFSARGEFMPCLFLLALGAALDGLDGAAARRWGGSAWGVDMDDLADAASYGVAPGYALFAAIGGGEGACVGLAFTLFVITRLVYFTLSKKSSDPNFFRGVPSTVGGLIAISTLLVLPHSPLAVGFLVGLACAAMVSFDVQHRHLGRALTSRSARRYALAFVLLLAFGAALGGVHAAAWLVLLMSLGYGFLPSLVALWRLRH